MIHSDDAYYILVRFGDMGSICMAIPESKEVIRSLYNYKQHYNLINKLE